MTASLPTEDEIWSKPPVLPDHPPDDERLWVEQGTAPRDGFNFRSIGELMDEPEVPVDWLLDGLLVRGTVSLLTAKPKTGKSVLARCLALAVAQGRPFLGRTTTQGEVLYLCLEERCQDVRRDFELMGATRRDPLLIDDTAVPGIPGLCAYVLQRKPTLAVLDPLQRLLRIEDGNNYAQTYNAFSPLIECASKTNTHILVLHHSSSKVERDALASPLGSTGLAAVAASILVLRRLGDQRSLETVQRIGHDLKQTLLCFDGETKTLSLGDSVAEALSSRSSEMVLNLLARKGELTQEKIREECQGIGSQHIRVALTTLLREGKVQFAGRGKRGDPKLYSVSAESGFGGFAGFSDASNPHAKPETRNAGKSKTNEEEEVEKGGFENRLSIVKPENQKPEDALQPSAPIDEKVVLPSKVVSENQKPLPTLKDDADRTTRVPCSTVFSPTSVPPIPDGGVATTLKGEL